MRRRQVGIAGLQRSMQAKDAYRTMGDQLAASQLAHFQDLMLQFKKSLEVFAKQHREAILNDPSLRIHFQQMCTSIGVDPFTYSKGFWNEILGLGDYFYDLGLQLIEYSITRRDQSGGLFTMKEVCDHLNTNELDVKKAIHLLQPLGAGYQIVDLMNEKCLVTIPKELNMDANLILDSLQSSTMSMSSTDPIMFQGMTIKELANRLNWEMKRVELALLLLLSEGQIWVDETPSSITYYYYDSFLDASLPMS